MCKPGYTWNEVVGKCLMGGFVREGDTVNEPKPEQPEMPAPDTAIKQEKAMRMSKPKAVK